MTSETIQSISKKANQRKKVALSYNIPKKARLLAEALGEPYYSSHDFYGGDFAGDLSSSNKGHEFKNKDIRILSYIKRYDDKEKYSVIEIYIKPEGLLKSIIHGFSERVYHQQDNKVEMFKEMHRWVDELDSLYDWAVKNKGVFDYLKKEEDSKEKIKELKGNFGLF